MKPGIKCTVPGILITVVVSTVNRRYSGSSATTIREFGWANVTLSRRARGKWKLVKSAELDSPELLREWIQENGDEHRTNYVVAPTATEVFTLARIWEMFDVEGIANQSTEGVASKVRPCSEGSPGIILGRFVVRGKPDIIEYRRRGKRFVWLSGFQYFPAGPGLVLSGEVHRASQGSFDQEDSGDYDRRAQCQAEAWRVAIIRLTEWWAANAKAPWGLTAGQLALGMLRSYITPKSLCSHSDRDAHKLERDASYGGRASVWFVGTVSAANHSRTDNLVDEPTRLPCVEIGPATQVDCRAMYPTILRDGIFPVKLIGTYSDCDIGRLVESAKSLGVIARVSIRTTLPEYPYRSGEIVKFPIGQFTTTLTGPEILELSQHGEILKCHEMATYHLGCPFAKTAEHLLRARQEACSAGDASAELSAKLIATSLGGKLAQRGGAWARRSALDGIEKWGEFLQTDAKTGEDVTRRFISGVCFEWKDDKEGVGPYQFAFAYLTAYGRIRMRRLRESLPERSVISQDTDGLWLLPSATSAVRAMPNLLGENPGDFRLVDTASEARFYGPRHYCCDGMWTLAGFSKPVVGEEGRTIWDSVDQTLWFSIPREPPTKTLSHIRKCKFPLDIAGGTVDHDGWVRPPYMRPTKLV